MKNFFKKIKSYSFWVSLSGAVIVLFNAFGNAFGFEIENKIVEDCIMSIASVLVVFGIVSMNGKEKAKSDENQDNLEIKEIDGNGEMIEDELDEKSPDKNGSKQENKDE